jgi:hypothetical protein
MANRKWVAMQMTLALALGVPAMAYEFDPFAPIPIHTGEESGPDVPAGLVEEMGNFALPFGWQLEDLYDDSPIEDLLAENTGGLGGYALPESEWVAGVPAAPSGPVEEAWLEYLRLNQEQYGLLGTHLPPTIEPVYEEEIRYEEMRLPASFEMTSAAAAAEVPEISSLGAVALGAALYGLNRLRAQRRA